MGEYTGAQSLYNGISQAGQSLGAGIGQAIQNYRQNKLMVAQSTAKFEAAVSQDPKLMQFLASPQASQTSPDVTAAAQRLLKGGSVNLKDAALLGTFADSWQSQKAIQTQQANVQSQTDANNLQNQMAQNRLGYLQQLMGAPGAGAGPQQGPSMAQSLSGQGQGSSGAPPASVGQFLPQGSPSQMQQQATGVPSPTPSSSVTIQPPTPVGMSDPRVQQAYAQAMRMTLGDPDRSQAAAQQAASAINQQQTAAYQAQAGASKPTGNLYFKRIDYKDGLPQMDVYSPEIIKGPGTASQSMSAGDQEITVPHGTRPPGQVVQIGTGAPAQSQASPYNTNDPTWQKDVQQAYSDAASSGDALASAKLLNDAAQAYVSGGTPKFNQIMANPAAAKLLQFFSGTNPLDGLKMALSYNTSAVMNQIRSGNGSVGGRILQNEYDNTRELLGNPSMPPQQLLDAAQNNYLLRLQHFNLDKSFAHYREIMPSGEAEAMAVKQFGELPPALATMAAPSSLVAPNAPASTPSTPSAPQLPAGWTLRP